MAKLIFKAPYYKPGHGTESGKSRGGYAEYIATREPYLSREGIHNLKQTFATDIFRQELTSIYKKQTEVRDNLKEKYKTRIAKVVAEIKNGDYAISPELVMKMQLLSEKLEKHKGKRCMDTFIKIRKPW